MTRDTLLRDLGAFMVLLERAPVQQRYPLRFLYTRLWPPLQTQQYLLQWQDQRPLAFVTWAWLTPETSAHYRIHRHVLQATDWNAGDQLWFMEIIADHTQLLPLMQAVRQRLPPRTLAQWHRVTASGQVQHHSLRLP